MTAIRLTCPRCAGTGWDSHDDRHTETIMDRCRACGGAGQIRSATGERREASCDPVTGRPFGEDRTPPPTPLSPSTPRAQEA